MYNKRYDSRPNHRFTCGECIRFCDAREEGKHNCRALSGPNDITADRKACLEYIDRAAQEREEREQEEREERERQARWEQNKNNPPRPAKWESDIDYITGEPTGAMPFCPNCDEPLYYFDQCYFCGQLIEQDEKMKEHSKPPEVHHMDCFCCGGKDTLEYTVSSYNGHKHGSCAACGMRFIE